MTKISILQTMLKSIIPRQHSSRSRVGSFDFLRLAFALGVVYTHSVRFIDGDNHRELLQALFGIQSEMGYGIGDLGVCGFFAISGFLITGAWERSPMIWNFLKNRFLRIAPGFVVASILSQTIFVFIASRRIATWLKEVSLKTRLLELLTVNPPSARFPFFAGKFYAHERPWTNGSMWTLLHEVRCYALAGVFGLVSTYLLKRRATALWLLTLIAGIMLIASGFQIPKFHGYVTLIAWQTYWVRFIGCFATGALYRRFHTRFTHQEKFIPLTVVLLGVCLAHESWLPFALPTVWAVLVLQLGTSPTLSRILPHPSRDLSYGTFLYAWPVQMVLLNAFPDLGLWFHLPAAAVISLFLGWMSWTFVESPALRLKVSAVPG